ncbi:MAG: peptidoglycan DD-metalloendopeptidase family protein [Bacteroidales bacterium]|nr:peptidoglycan DD-metalloendopeptidase family protein [Bacteroidales bacterium]
MVKKKKNEIYYLDTASLSVKKVKVSARQRLFKMLRYLVVALFFFGVAIFISINFFESPREKQLAEDLAAAKAQYSYLSSRVDELEKVVSDVHSRDRNLYRMIFEAEPPVPKAILRQNYSNFKDNTISKAIIQTSEKVDKLANDLYAQSISMDQIYDQAKQKEEYMRCVPAIYPVNKNSSHMSSGFGYRFHPIYKSLRMHTGTDIAAPQGTPVYATGNGRVTVADNSPIGYSGYGIVCKVNHGFGYETLYAHMNKLAVRPGQKVKRGDIVGYVGSTGASKGTHLHYEVLVNGKHVNPVYYFFIDMSPEEYLEIFEKAKEVNQSLS